MISTRVFTTTVLVLGACSLTYGAQLQASVCMFMSHCMTMHIPRTPVMCMVLCVVMMTLRGPYTMQMHAMAHSMVMMLVVFGVVVSVSICVSVMARWC